MEKENQTHQTGGTEMKTQKAYKINTDGKISQIRSSDITIQTDLGDVTIEGRNMTPQEIVSMLHSAIGFVQGHLCDDPPDDKSFFKTI